MEVSQECQGVSGGRDLGTGEVGFRWFLGSVKGVTWRLYRAFKVFQRVSGSLKGVWE